MKDIVKQLRELADRIENDALRLLEEEYQKQQHKEFACGDYVTDGKDIGKVAWLENKAMNIVKEQGYFGLEILNGMLGFKAPCKRDHFRLLTTTERRIFAEKSERKIYLSGIDIERILYRLSHCQDLINTFKDIRFTL